MDLLVAVRWSLARWFRRSDSWDVAAVIGGLLLLVALVLAVRASARDPREGRAWERGFTRFGPPACLLLIGLGLLAGGWERFSGGIAGMIPADVGHPDRDLLLAKDALDSLAKVLATAAHAGMLGLGCLASVAALRARLGGRPGTSTAIVLLLLLAWVGLVAASFLPKAEAVGPVLCVQSGHCIARVQLLAPRASPGLGIASAACFVLLFPAGGWCLWEAVRLHRSRGGGAGIGSPPRILLPGLLCAGLSLVAYPGFALPALGDYLGGGRFEGRPGVLAFLAGITLRSPYLATAILLGGTGVAAVVLGRRRSARPPGEGPAEGTGAVDGAAPAS